MEIFNDIPNIILMLLFCYLSFAGADDNINITQFESCSCDMTGGSCDILCCCDKECDESQKESFSCDSIPVQLHPVYDTCSDVIDTPEQGFHQLLCLHKENSPYLGHHFRDYGIVNDLPSLNDMLSKKIGPQLEEQSSTVTGARLGNFNVGVKGGYYHKQELLVISSNLRTSSLRFPYSVYGSDCDSFHPVRYLEDVSSTCLRDARKETLSSKDFDSLIIGLDGQKLLGDPHDELPLQDVTTKYFYIPHPCCYIDSADCKNASDIDCSSVSINSTEHDVAESLVLSAWYKFSWRGGRIYSADIKIIFGDFSVTSGTVKQKFSAVFKHVKSNPSKNQNNNKTEHPSFGYRIGNYILSYNQNDSMNSRTDSDDLNVTDSWSLLSVFDSNGGGTCDEDSIAVKFGHTVMAGCFHATTNWTDMDCWEIRKTVESSTLSSVFGISATGRGGNAEDVIVIEDDGDEPSPNNNTAVDGEEEPMAHETPCQEMPHQVTLELFYSESGVRTRDGTVTYVIVRAVRKYEWTSWEPMAKDRNCHSDEIPATKRHPMYASVHFRHISTEDIEKRARTKRSKLLDSAGSRRCDGETCWSDVLYFLREYSVDLDQFAPPDGYLSRMSYVFYLVSVVLVPLLVIALGSGWRKNRRFQV